MKFNPPPYWRPFEPGSEPEPGWQPDHTYPPLPQGWELWLPEQPRALEEPVPDNRPSTTRSTVLFWLGAGVFVLAGLYLAWSIGRGRHGWTGSLRVGLVIMVAGVVDEGRSRFRDGADESAEPVRSLAGRS